MPAQLTRIPPRLGGPEHYKTYIWVRPVTTHWMPATCEEVGCEAYENGWVTLIDENSELGQRQAHYIRRESRRKFTEERTPEGLTQFRFPAGQMCFRASSHRAPIERPPRYLVKEGDWRGNPRGTPVYVHKSGDEWLEDFAEHQERLKQEYEKG